MLQGRPWYKDPDRLIWILLFLLLAERLLLFFQLGPDYMSHSDDDAYIASGLFFADTGVIAIDGLPGALTMPGMAVTIGVTSLFVGDGLALLITLKIIWIIMGVFTAWWGYKTLTLFASGWAGLFAAAHFLLPNMAWMNHVILTETPYIFFFSICIYAMFYMRKADEKKGFVLYTAGFLLALMFRSNIILLPLFTGVYLLITKKNPRQTIKYALCFLVVVSLFLVPWTIRNYIQFGDFIPLTYGAGDPLYLGTYEGVGYPNDEDLDYETNVSDVMKDKYADYYDETGNVKESQHKLYLYMMERGIKARYRIREWWRSNPTAFLKSYLLIKPRLMLNWVWAWEEVFGVTYQTLHRISQMNMIFCFFTVILALFTKKMREPVFLLSLFYITSVYVYATAFVTDRYASTLMIIRYIIAGFGMQLCRDTFVELKKRQGGRMLG